MSNLNGGWDYSTYDDQHKHVTEQLEGSHWFRPGKETHLVRCLCHGRWSTLRHRHDVLPLCEWHPCMEKTVVYKCENCE